MESQQSALVKQKKSGGVVVERAFISKSDGAWSAYTHRWNFCVKMLTKEAKRLLLRNRSGVSSSITEDQWNDNIMNENGLWMFLNVFGLDVNHTLLVMGRSCMD